MRCWWRCALDVGGSVRFIARKKRAFSAAVQLPVGGWKDGAYGGSGGSGPPVRWCHVAEMWAARCSVKLALVSRAAKEEGFKLQVLICICIWVL
jgi:hypothetical protein